MFDLLKKEKKCLVCGISDKTDKIIGFDPSNRGKLPERGARQYLCIRHLSEKWTIELRKYSGFSIFYLPKKGWNSYSYTTLENAKGWGIPEEEIAHLNGLINGKSNASCRRCSEKARFMLISDFNGETVSLERPKLFCGEHFVKRIMEEIRSENLSIDEINIPFGNKGIYMNGEY